MTVLRRIFRPGFAYKKAGVMLSGLADAHRRQTTVEEYLAPRPGDDRLMAALDRVNERFGRDTLYFGSSGRDHTWEMQRRHTSPAFTSRWEDLPPVRAA